MEDSREKTVHSHSFDFQALKHDFSQSYHVTNSLTSPSKITIESHNQSGNDDEDDLEIQNIDHDDNDKNNNELPKPYRTINEVKQKVIDEIANDIDQINNVKAYRLKYSCLTFLTGISVLVGIFFLLYGFAVSSLFSGQGKNYIFVGVSILFFMPMIIWIRYYCFPTKLEKEQNDISRYHLKRHHRMKKKLLFIAKGKENEYHLDDEYVSTENVFIPQEEYMNKSKTRGNFYDYEVTKHTYDGDKYKSVTDYSQDNGYMNDYYYKHIIYPERFQNTNLNNNQPTFIPSSYAFHQGHLHSSQTNDRNSMSNILQIVTLADIHMNKSLYQRAPPLLNHPSPKSPKSPKSSILKSTLKSKSKTISTLKSKNRIQVSDISNLHIDDDNDLNVSLSPSPLSSAQSSPKLKPSPLSKSSTRKSFHFKMTMPIDSTAIL